MNNIEYYFARDGRQVGPVSLEQLQREGLTRETLVWRRGMSEWKPAGQLAELAPLLKQQPPPLPAGPPVISKIVTKTAAAKGPWNPEAIGILSVVFTVVWGGVMTAVNARRLGMPAPWWRPVGIGVAYLVLDGLLGSWLGDSYLISLLIHLGSVGVLWVTDLDGQAKQFKSLSAGSNGEGKWLVPGLAGAPLALLSVIYFLIMPFAPLEPREVCRRLFDAQTESEFKKYATLKLQPALIALSKFDEDSDAEYELLGEEETAAGGRLVGFRMVGTDQGKPVSMDGYLHLLELDEGWRVDELYFTGFDGQAVDQPIPLSSNYQQIVFAAGLNQLTRQRSSTTSGATSNSLQSLAKKPAAWSFGWRLLVVLGAGAAALARSIFKSSQGAK